MQCPLRTNLAACLGLLLAGCGTDQSPSGAGPGGEASELAWTDETWGEYFDRMSGLVDAIRAGDRSSISNLASPPPEAAVAFALPPSAFPQVDLAWEFAESRDEESAWLVLESTLQYLESLMSSSQSRDDWDENRAMLADLRMLGYGTSPPPHGDLPALRLWARLRPEQVLPLLMADPAHFHLERASALHALGRQDEASDAAEAAFGRHFHGRRNRGYELVSALTGDLPDDVVAAALPVALRRTIEKNPGNQLPDLERLADVVAERGLWDQAGPVWEAIFDLVIDERVGGFWWLVGEDLAVNRPDVLRAQLDRVRARENRFPQVWRNAAYWYGFLGEDAFAQECQDKHRALQARRDDRR